MRERILDRPPRGEMEYCAVFMHGCKEEMDTTAATALAVQSPPPIMGRQYLYLLDYPPADAMNYAVGWARNAKAQFVVLWKYGFIANRTDAMCLLLAAMRLKPEIELVTNSTELHEHVYTVMDGDFSLMFARVSMFDKLAEFVEEYDVDDEGHYAGRFFTERDLAGKKLNPAWAGEPPVSDFAALCNRAGVQWWEHGGVVCANGPEELVAADILREKVVV